MYKILFENNLYYDEKEKCLKKIRWRAEINGPYYCIDWNRFITCKAVEAKSDLDNIRYRNLNYFQTKEEAEKKLFEIKSVLDD